MLLAAWALIPAKALETTWTLEQEQMSIWTGEAARHWVMSQAMSAMRETAMDTEQIAATLGDNPVEHWLVNRLFTSLLWGNLIAFRGYSLSMWGLLGLPLLLAASVDAFYVRQIRKTAFISQSPIRHKIGVITFRLAGIALLLWLCLPVPMPAIIPLVLVCCAAFALWMWVGHLQKRL